MKTKKRRDEFPGPGVFFFTTFGQFLVDCFKYSNPKKDRKVIYHSCSWISLFSRVCFWGHMKLASTFFQTQDDPIIWVVSFFDVFPQPCLGCSFPMTKVVINGCSIKIRFEDLSS